MVTSGVRLPHASVLNRCSQAYMLWFVQIGFLVSKVLIFLDKVFLEWICTDWAITDVSTECEPGPGIALQEMASLRGCKPYT